MKVKEIMQKEVITVTPETEIVKATMILLDNRINGVPVIDEKGKVVGILCQSDLVAPTEKNPPALSLHLSGWFHCHEFRQAGGKRGQEDRRRHRR